MYKTYLQKSLDSLVEKQYDSIDAENVNYGKQEKGMTDRYLYSKTTEKVYYEYGLSVNDKVYYYIENGEV